MDSEELVARTRASFACVKGIRLALGALASAIICACAPQPAPAIASKATGANPPNIVIVLVDDLGWADVGYNGSTFYETPAIDQLAQDGIRFDNAYVAYPRCVPSRYALMTGRNPARAAIPGGAGGEVMESEEITIAEGLKQAGYATFFAGKWHLGKTPATSPEGQGFDINIGGGSAGAVASHFWPFAPETLGRLGPGLEQGEEGEYLADRLTDETIAFIRDHLANDPEKPFFALLSHYGVHTPLQGKPELVERFSAKLRSIGGAPGPAFDLRDGKVKLHQDDPVYAAMVYSIDESVARLRAELEALGIAESTVIIFTSDHGGLSNTRADGNRRLATSNLPLRAGKGHVYEGGIKVPLVVAWPGTLAKGQVSAALVNNTDLFPSLLKLAGAAPMPEAHLDGMTMLFTGGGDAGNALAYWHSPRPRPRNTGDRAASAIREGRWKYILSYDPAQPSALFDLAADPYETTNLSDHHPALVAHLRGRLEAWLAEVDAVEPSLDRRGRERARSE